MPLLSRRWMLAMLAGASPLVAMRSHAAPSVVHARFVAQAFAMKQKAIENGDQAYGAVVVRGDRVVGFGPSNVKGHGEWVGHAEREAMRDAQARLGRSDLSDCVMYSTSPPCSRCRQAAAEARLGRMYAGPAAADLGPPQDAR